MEKEMWDDKPQFKNEIEKLFAEYNQIKDSMTSDEQINAECMILSLKDSIEKENEPRI